jgi:hypothetical protein
MSQGRQVAAAGGDAFGNTGIRNWSALASRVLSFRSGSKGRPLEPIENAQNREEYLWGNLEMFGNSLELSSLEFNNIKGLTERPACPATAIPG